MLKSYMYLSVLITLSSQIIHANELRVRTDATETRVERGVATQQHNFSGWSRYRTDDHPLIMKDREFDQNLTTPPKPDILKSNSELFSVDNWLKADTQRTSADLKPEARKIKAKRANIQSSRRNFLQERRALNQKRAQERKTIEKNTVPQRAPNNSASSNNTSPIVRAESKPTIPPKVAETLRIQHGQIEENDGIFKRLFHSLLASPAAE